MGFHGEALLAPRPTPKLEDHPSSAARDCLFNLFAATLHIGGCSSIRNLRTRHAVVTGTHFTWIYIVLCTSIKAIKILRFYIEFLYVSAHKRNLTARMCERTLFNISLFRTREGDLFLITIIQSGPRKSSQGP